MRLSDTDRGVRLARLGVRRPVPVLVVSGTTADLDPELAKRLLPMLSGVVAAAGEHKTAMVTGGTDAGVFHLLGLALSSAVQRPRAVVGVVPDGRVAPTPQETEPGERRVPVAPQLSTLVRVPGD